MKNNLARLGHGLAFRVEQLMVEQDGTTMLASHIRWLEEEIERGVNAVLADLAETHDSAVSEAEDFLQEFLEAGRHRVTEIREAAKGHGLAWRTIERAKRRLNVLSINSPETGGKHPRPCWFWELPLDGPSPTHGGVAV